MAIRAEQVPGRREIARRANPGSNAAVAAVLVLVGLGFLVYAGGQLGAPFGESHDGTNGAIWANGSRYLRDVGPIVSAFGGRRPGGGFYANHPPLIYPLTALGELLAGEGPWATRAPAWIATLVSIPLLWAILRRVGLGRTASTIGVAVAATTPMLFVYGAMLDTPILAFPIGLLVFLLWLRAWEGGGPPPWVAGVLAFVAALTAWQAVFAVGLAALTLGWQSHRRRSSRAIPVALALGTGAGLAITAVWAAWASGSATGLVDQFFLRSGGEGGATWSRMVAHQTGWLIHLLGLAVVGVVVCGVVAVRGRGTRRRAAIGSLVVVGGYAVLLHSGADAHQYWNYWVILPVALGIGLGVEAVLVGLRDRDVSRRAAVAVVVVAALAVVATSRMVPSGDRQMIDAGIVPARLLSGQALPADQSEMRYIGAIYSSEPWMTYLTDRPTEALTDEAELFALAVEQPDAVLLATNSCLEDDALCISAARLAPDVAVASATDEYGTRYRLYTAAELAAHLVPAR